MATKQEAIEEAKFIVYYDKEGEAMYIEPGKGCSFVAEGEEVASPDFLEKIKKEKNKPNVNKKTVLIYSIHGSPGCYIYIDTRKVCIC